MRYLHHFFGSVWSCLQFFNSIRWHVFWHCVFSFCEGFIVNGVINIIIVTLEKRYELTSKKSGMIASANDFGAAALLILVGYLGTYANKPRLMAAGMFLMSLGCLVFALPQFIGDEYTYSISSEYDSQLSVCFYWHQEARNKICTMFKSALCIYSAQCWKRRLYYSMSHDNKIISLENFKTLRLFLGYFLFFRYNGQFIGECLLYIQL